MSQQKMPYTGFMKISWSSVVSAATRSECSRATVKCSLQKMLSCPQVMLVQRTCTHFIECNNFFSTNSSVGNRAHTFSSYSWLVYLCSYSQAFSVLVHQFEFCPWLYCSCSYVRLTFHFNLPRVLCILLSCLSLRGKSFSFLLLPALF